MSESNIGVVARIGRDCLPDSNALALSATQIKTAQVYLCVQAYDLRVIITISDSIQYVFLKTHLKVVANITYS